MTDHDSFSRKSGIKLRTKSESFSPPTSGLIKTEAFRFLKSTREFSQLPDIDLILLANSSRFQNLKSGDFITNEGEDESPSGFIVVSGRLAMLKTSINGKELIVELLQERDNFGLLLKLAAKRIPSQLSARALQKSTVLWIPTTILVETLSRNPMLFKEFIAHLIICLHSSYRLARGLAHDRVEIRIAALLYSLSQKFAEPLPADQVSIIKFTRQQLADLAGTTTETSIRITRAMQREGLIDISCPGVIRILDHKALQILIDE